MPLQKGGTTCMEDGAGAKLWLGMSGCRDAASEVIVFEWRLVLDPWY